MSKELLNTDNSVTNYWWDCPSCGTTKISSVLHDEKGEIKGATMCCPECFYVLKGEENIYVDETVYEIPPEWVALLEKPRWKCQQCGALNEKPADQELSNLTIDDLYCQSCETWQCDIPGTPSYNPDAALKRYQQVQAQSRWENPILPIEFEPEPKDVEGQSVPFPQKMLSAINLSRSSFGLKLGILGILLSAGLWIYDGLRVKTIKGVITNPRATVSVDISKYNIIEKEGWKPNKSAPDYKLVSQYEKQDGTRQVPDGIETYFVTERYIARYETETYTDTVTERVKTGTKTVKGKCRTVTSGAVAKTKCKPDRTKPVYSNKTKQVTKTREVPVYDTRQVKKTRTKYRTEPVYRTWYVWQQGEWSDSQTLTAKSHNFDLKYPDTSKFTNQANFRVEKPEQKCRITITAEHQKLPAQDREIDCNLYTKLSQDDTGVVLYRRWGGIEDIRIADQKIGRKN